MTTDNMGTPNSSVTTNARHYMPAIECNTSNGLCVDPFARFNEGTDSEDNTDRVKWYLVDF